MTKIKRCYKGKPLDNINLKSGDSYHEGVENISNILAGDDLPDDIYLNFEDDDEEDCRPKKETLGCDDCRKDPDYIYCGKDLPVIGINNGDSYEDIFEAINNAINECLDSTVLVKYENGDEIEFVTLSGGEHKEVIVPNCIPSEVQIYNSEGTLLQTITVEQGQSIEYTTPDSTAEIRYIDGTLITTVNIPSGETQTIYIPNCEPTITYIVDEVSNPLGEVVLESGTQGTFVCPNGIINVENSLGEVIGTGSVLSGGSGLVTVGDTNIVVEYADGTPITTESIPSSTSDITITVPNCEDVEVTLENSAGLELDNETYVSGTTNTMLAPDATYVLKDTAGTTITTDAIPSGQSENVIAPDATYTLTNTVPTTITSGNIVSNGNAIIVAPDTNYKINNSNGTELSSGSIPSDTLDTLIAPDAIVEVKDQDGNLLDSGNAPSNITTTFTVNIPQPTGWHRPLWWLKQPTIGDENVVWELMTVFAGDQNPYTNNLQASGGVTTEFYSDINDPTPFYTATANNNTLIDFDDCNPIAGQFVRQCWAKSYPTNPANNWGTVDFVQPHNIYGNYSSQIVERIISCKTTHPTVGTNHRMGVGISISNMLENIEYRNKMPFKMLYNWLYFTPILKQILFENQTIIEGASSDCTNVFTASGLQTFPKNLTLKSFYSYQTFANSNLSECYYDFEYVLATGYQTFYNTKANIIKGTNMGSVPQNVGDFTFNNLYWLELHGYTLGHALNGNAMKGEETFKAWVDSLGNASGTQTITVSTLQFNSFGGLGSYVDNELFAKGYTLNVV